MEGYFIHIANHVERIRSSHSKTELPRSFSGKIIKELKSWELWRSVLAEFIATLLFVFIGTMSTLPIVPEADDWAKIIRVRIIFSKCYQYYF
jgi:hypothetical protein